jgi:hypothetical protein
MYYESCGNQDPHNHHVYEVDGEYRECAGIPSRSED